MRELINKYPIPSIIVLVIIMLGFSIDSLEVTIMEARNFITAREMFTDNNWLLTTINGEARYEKPPLPTWITAISGMLFGFKNIIALRFPGILMIGIIGIVTYLMSLKISLTKEHAFINSLISITSFYIFGIIIEAPWDIFTHGFMLIGILQLIILFKDSEVKWRNAFIAGLCIGLSILSKGPVSLYALLLPFLIAFGITYKYKHIRSKTIVLAFVIILALIVGGWWYLYVRVVDPETFIKIASKETGNWGSYNVRPFYYYWSFFTQSGIWTIPAFIGLLYPYLKTRVSNVKGYQFSFYWTLIAVILLSIIPEKKSRYLMPVLIPLAINTGFYIEYLFRRFKSLNNKRETLPLYFNFTLIALVGFIFPFAGYYFFKENISSFWLHFTIASITLFSISVLMVLALKRKQIKHVFYLTVVFMVSAYFLVLPLSKHIKNNDYKNVSSLYQLHPEMSQLNIYGYKLSPESIWAYGNKIPVFDSDSISKYKTSNAKFGLLESNLSESDKKLIQDNFNMELLDTFDLNSAQPDTRSYKSRLKSNLYLLSKK